MSIIEEGWKVKTNSSGKKIKYMDVIGAVICKFDIKTNKKSYLLIQRAKDDHWPNHWEFPRGKCDKSKTEKLFPCLRREVKEETNLDVLPIKFIDTFQYSADGGERISTQTNYLCYLKPGKQELKLSHEHQDYKWVSNAGEIELLLNNEMKNTFLKVFPQEEMLSSKPGYIQQQNSTDNKIEEALNIIFEGFR